MPNRNRTYTIGTQALINNVVNKPIEEANETLKQLKTTGISKNGTSPTGERKEKLEDLYDHIQQLIEEKKMTPTSSQNIGKLAKSIGNSIISLL
jgi:Mg2+ and Co2+ transporter CorA